MVSVLGINFNSNIKQQATSFKGHNLASNDLGEKVYKFFIPKVNYNDAKVILRKFDLDENGNVDLDSKYKTTEIPLEKGKAFVEVNPKELDLSVNEVLGYRFLIDGIEYNDRHRFVTSPDGKTYNIAGMLSSDVLTTPKSIYHLVPSSFNPKLSKTEFVNALEQEVVNDDKVARINHFMKYNSSLKDVIEKIPYIKSLGFRRILSTPVFGQDNLSSHGYWTTNPFQITSSLGNMNDFKKLQIELFKNSMGYIADGAFTNEGLEGIHLRDILRNGNNSPFIHWFELINYPDENIRLGILPDKQEAYDNVEIRVINSPVIWEVDKEGRPTENFGKINRAYNTEKETYIQIYDKRLTSLEQLSKDEPFTAYDIKNPQNPDDITGWMDSVRPYVIPVNPKDVIKHAKDAKDDKNNLPKEHLVQWENFELSRANEASGMLFWTGNKDIPKLRFVFSDAKKRNVETSAPNRYAAVSTIKNIEEATGQVQDYIVNIGKFWTNKTSKFLREYIANELGTVSSPEEFKKIINKKAGHSLPEAVKYITVEQIKNALNDKYVSIRTLSTPLNIKSALKEYPIQTVEVSDSLISIFSYPNFSKSFDSVILPDMEKITSGILKKLDYKNILPVKFYDGESLSKDSLKNLQLISDDIMRFLIIKSLNPEINSEDIFSYNKTSLEKLNKLSYASMGIASNKPDESASLLIKLMRKNLKNITEKDKDFLVDYLGRKYSMITPKNIKVANLIIDKTEAGLNWRIDAAKDIAPQEEFEEQEATIRESWKEVADFWKKFNLGVKAYNNHSYKIGEFTDTAVSYSSTNSAMQNAGDIEHKIAEQSGFTTQTNYTYLFELLQKYYSVMAEHDFSIENTDAFKLINDKLIKGWNGVPGYLYSGNKNNISFSHVAVGNHDKQRVAHTFSLNALLVYKKYWDAFGNEMWSKQEKADIQKDLLASGLEKSRFYNMIQKANYDKLFNMIDQQNLAKMAAFTDAMNVALTSANIDKEIKDNIMSMYTDVLESFAEKGSKKEKMFFYKNFEATYEDIIKELKNRNADIATLVEKLQPAVHRVLTKPARQREIELAKLIVALPGNPSLYAGDELLELGGEEKSRNYSFQNRNRLHWENLSNPEYIHVRNYKDKLSQIYALRNDKDLSCLVNGDTILLDKQTSSKKSRDVFGLYRYNEHDDAIILLNNRGYNSYRHIPNSIKISLDKIDLSGKDSVGNGLPAGKKLEKDVKFADALNPEKQFVVGEDGCLYAQNGEPIVITNSVVILKRIK